MLDPVRQAELEALAGHALNAEDATQIEALLTPVRDDAGIAAILSRGRTAVKVPFLVSARGFASKYPGGPLAAEVVLMKLEGAAAAMKASSDQSTKVFGSLLSRQLSFFNTDAGLDFGDTTLRAMIDQLAGAAVITADEAAKMKAIAVAAHPVQAWEVAQLFLGVPAGRAFTLVVGQIVAGDSRWRVAQAGDYEHDALVPCYALDDPDKKPICALPAHFVAGAQE